VYRTRDSPLISPSAVGALKHLVVVGNVRLGERTMAEIFGAGMTVLC
jgi:hypothetical protein